MINKITNNDLSAAKAAKTAIIDFSAQWCGPCKMLEPVFEQLSSEIDDAEFFSADVDLNPTAAAEYNVMSIPNIVLLKNGEFADSQIGFSSKDMLKNWINENLAK